MDSTGLLERFRSATVVRKTRQLYVLRHRDQDAKPIASLILQRFTQVVARETFTVGDFIDWCNRNSHAFDSDNKQAVATVIHRMCDGFSIIEVPYVSREDSAAFEEMKRAKNHPMTADFTDIEWLCMHLLDLVGVTD